MKYGTCLLAQAPMRATAAHRSEMVNQILFGETFTIIDESEADWIQIRLTSDSYQGWMQRSQATFLSDQQYFDWLAASKVVVTKFNTKLFYKGGFHRIPFGTLLPAEPFELANVQFDGNFVPSKNANASICQLSYSFLDVPYLWGGRTAAGLDCSGFTQLLYRTQGIQLMRDSSQQSGQGNTVSSLKEVTPGDLAFFTEGKQQVSHVGLLLGCQEVIHASGSVKINRVDDQGILNENGEYTHQLHSIRRMSTLA